VDVGLVHGPDLLRGKASGIGQTSVLDDDAYRYAKCHCYSFMGEFAHVFTTQWVLILRVEIFRVSGIPDPTKAG
jgi:hypothetical protein